MRSRKQALAPTVIHVHQSCFYMDTLVLLQQQGYWKWCLQSRQILPSVGNPVGRWWCQRSSLKLEIILGDWNYKNTFVYTLKERNCFFVFLFFSLTSYAVAPCQESKPQHGVAETQHHTEHVQKTDHFRGRCADQHRTDHEAQQSKQLDGGNHKNTSKWNNQRHGRS